MVIYVILELIYFQVLTITEKEIINSTPENILYNFLQERRWYKVYDELLEIIDKKDNQCKNILNELAQETKKIEIKLSEDI